MALEIGGGISIGGGINVGHTTTFIISSSDFTQGQAINTDTVPQGSNGNEGFINTVAQSNLDQGYVGLNLIVGAVENIKEAFGAAGLDYTNPTGYVWYVRWAEGSSITTGLVKFGFNDNFPESFYIQTIDPADPDWEIPGSANGTSLTGTFLFPATFTIYYPLTSKGNWC